jgi:hypothetical protein
MTQGKISDMISQSRDVLSKRDIATFGTHENKGSLQDAIIYMAIAAAITGLFGLTGGISGLITGILST